MAYQFSDASYIQRAKAYVKQSGDNVEVESITCSETLKDADWIWTKQPWDWPNRRTKHIEHKFHHITTAASGVWDWKLLEMKGIQEKTNLASLFTKHVPMSSINKCKASYMA